MGTDDPLSPSSPVVRVEFALRDQSHLFTAVTTGTDCRIRLEAIVLRGQHRYAEFFSVHGGDPDRVYELAARTRGVEPRMLARYEREALFEFLVTTDDCPAVFLGEQGALPRTLHGADGETRLVAAVPGQEDAEAIVDRFLSTYPEATLVTKRTATDPALFFGDWDGQRAGEYRLTERQREVLRTAYEAGYYAWPRESTAEEVAEDLGIAGATLHKHLRAAERKLVGTLFEPSGVDV